MWQANVDNHAQSRDQSTPNWFFSHRGCHVGAKNDIFTNLWFEYNNLFSYKFPSGDCKDVFICKILCSNLMLSIIKLIY